MLDASIHVSYSPLIKLCSMKSDIWPNDLLSVGAAACVL